MSRAAAEAETQRQTSSRGTPAPFIARGPTGPRPPVLACKERFERRLGHADRVGDPYVGDLAVLAKAVRGRSTDSQERRDFLDGEKGFAWPCRYLRLLSGDTGATSLASPVVANRGLSILACRSPFRISRACDAVSSRLTRGKRRRCSSGPGGRRFKSCL